MPGVRRRGKHQRLRDGPAMLAGLVPPRSRGIDGDAEVDLLCELWAIGLLSSTLLQSIAAASVLAAPRPQMQTLARLGTSGRHGSNVHRGLQHLLEVGDIKVVKQQQQEQQQQQQQQQELQQQQQQQHSDQHTLPQLTSCLAMSKRVTTSPLSKPLPVMEEPRVYIYLVNWSPAAPNTF